MADRDSDFVVPFVGGPDPNVVPISQTPPGEKFVVPFVNADFPTSATAREQPGGTIAPGPFTKGGERGIAQTVGLFGQFTRAIGNETGFGSLVEIGDDMVEAAFVSAITNPAPITSIDEIDNARKAFEFVKQTLGEQAINLALAATGAGMGASAAKLAIGKAAALSVARRAALHGAAAGTFGAFLPINTGEILAEQRDAGFDPDFAGSLALGSVSSALEVLGFGIIGSAVFKGFSKPMVDATVKNVLGRIGHASLKGLAGEGGTEAVQEALVIASKRLKDPTFDVQEALLGEEGRGRIAFAGLSGAVVGGLLGGAGRTGRAGVDLARMGLEKAHVRTALESFKAGASATLDPVEKEAPGLVDFEIARRKIKEGLETVRERVQVARETARNFREGKGRVQEADVKAARAAVHDAVVQVRSALSAERGAEKTSENVLREFRKRSTRAAMTLVVHAKNIANKTAGLELSAEDSQARHDASERIDELRKRAKKAGKRERMDISREMFELAEELVLKGIAHPTKVPGKKVATMVREAYKYMREGLDGRQKQANISRSFIRTAEMRINRTASNQEQPGVTEGEGTTTPVGEVVRSIDALMKSDRKFVFAVNETISSLPQPIREAISRHKLGVYQQQGRVVIGRSQDIRDLRDGKVDPDAESFQTPLSEATTVATERSPQGRVVRNEGVTAEQARERTETRDAGEAIVESLKELNEEARRDVREQVKKHPDPVTQAYRNITQWLNDNPDRSPADIPNSLMAFVDEDGTFYTFGEFKDMYSDVTYLMETFQNLDQFWQDPDSLTDEDFRDARNVEDLNDLLQNMMDGIIDSNEAFGLGLRQPEAENDVYYGMTGNNRVILLEPKTVDGQEVLATHTSLKNTNDTQLKQSAENNKFLKDALKGAGAYHPVKRKVAVWNKETNKYDIREQSVLQIIYPNEIAPFHVRAQIARVIKRGIQSAVKQEDGSYRSGIYTIEARSPTGGKVFLHLGEITELGRMLNPQRNTTVFDRMTRGLENFLEGMAALQMDFGYTFETRKAQPKGSKKRFNVYTDLPQNKIIYGNISLRKARAAKRTMENLRRIARNTMKDLVDDSVVGIIERDLKTLTERFDNLTSFLYTMQDYAQSHGLDQRAGRIQQVLDLIDPTGQLRPKSTPALRETELSAMFDATLKVLGPVMKFRKQELKERNKLLDRIDREFRTKTNREDLPTWNEIADWLLDEGNKGNIDPDDVAAVLFAQGVADPALIKRLREETIYAEDMEHDVGFKFETEFEDYELDPTVVNYQPGKKDRTGPQVVYKTNDKDTFHIQELATNILKALGIKQKVVIFDDTTIESIAEEMQRWAEYFADIADAQPTRAGSILRGDFEKAGIDLSEIGGMDDLLERIGSPEYSDATVAEKLAAFYQAMSLSLEMASFQVEFSKMDDEEGKGLGGMVIVPYLKPPSATKIIGGLPEKHQVHYMFLPRQNNNVVNVLSALAHEIGHIVVATHFEKLPDDLKENMARSFTSDYLFPGQGGPIQEEAFANMIMVYTEEILKGQRRDIREAVAEEFGALDNRQVAILSEAIKQISEDSVKVFHYALNNQGRTDPHKVIPKEFRAFMEALLTHVAQEQGHLPATPSGQAPKGALNTDLARRIHAVLRATEKSGYVVPELMGDFHLHQSREATANPLTEIFGLNIQRLEVETDPEQTAERARDGLFDNYVDNWKDWAARWRADPKDAALSLVLSADSELRAMGRIGGRIANHFHSRPTSTDPSLTIPREIRQLSAKWYRRLNEVFTNVPGSRIPTWELWQELFTGEVQNRPEVERRKRMMKALLHQTPLAQVDQDIRGSVREVREYLTDFYEFYTNELGMTLRFRHDYYPLMLDTNKIEADRAGFEQILRDHGFTAEQAKGFRQRITRDGDGGLTNAWNDDVTADFFGPGFANKSHRSQEEGGKWTDELRHALVDGNFYQDDLATTMIAYTDMAVRRAVWQRRFQETDFSAGRRARYDRAGLGELMHVPVAKLLLGLREGVMSHNLTEWQYSRIVRDILPAYAGQLGFRTHPKVRKLSSNLVIYQNLRLLAFAIFSQFVDMGTMFARNEGWADHKAGLKVLLNKASRQEALEMLSAIGGMRQGLTEHVLNDQTLNTWMGGRAKRINDLFFRYNGMEGWTNLMRAMALESAKEFMVRNANKALSGDAKAQRYLDELDITPLEVVRWSADGRGVGSPRIQAAINRYIDESMIRPEAPIRPVWMSDPGYGVFSHLKGFLWGFHETFLRRVGREAKIHQNLLPMVMLGMLAMPFAMVGYELRKYITGSTQKKEGFDYFVEVVERSGLLGAFQLVADMEQAKEFGDPWGLALTGPTVEHFHDFLTSGDMRNTFARSVPVVAQSPPLRDVVIASLGGK